MKQGKLNYVTGDATRPQTDGPAIIVHVCNDIGGWARASSWRSPGDGPNPSCTTGTGTPIVRTTTSPLALSRSSRSRSNSGSPTSSGSEGYAVPKRVPPVRYDAIEAGLAIVTDHAAVLDASVHMPRIGCGLAGGQWERIEPLLQRTV